MLINMLQNASLIAAIMYDKNLDITGISESSALCGKLIAILVASPGVLEGVEDVKLSYRDDTSSIELTKVKKEIISTEDKDLNREDAGQTTADAATDAANNKKYLVRLNLNLNDAQKKVLGYTMGLVEFKDKKNIWKTDATFGKLQGDIITKDKKYMEELKKFTSLDLGGSMLRSLLEVLEEQVKSRFPAIQDSLLTGTLPDFTKGSVKSIQDYLKGTLAFLNESEKLGKNYLYSRFENLSADRKSGNLKNEKMIALVTSTKAAQLLQQGIEAEASLECIELVEGIKLEGIVIKDNGYTSEQLGIFTDTNSSKGLTNGAIEILKDTKVDITVKGTTAAAPSSFLKNALMILGSMAIGVIACYLALNYREEEGFAAPALPTADTIEKTTTTTTTEIVS